MPDYALCTNDECQKKDNCFRFRAVPSEFMQSYAAFEPVQKMSGISCDGFIPLYNMTHYKLKPIK